MPRKDPIQRLPTSIRLTPLAKRLWELLAQRAGVSQAAWLETTIRKEARREKLKAEEEGAE